MPGGSLNREWAAIITVLAAALALGAALFIWNYPASPPVEVVLPSPSPASGQVYVGGEVGSPGLYPWPPGLTLEEAIDRAGGPTVGAEPGVAELTVPPEEGAAPPKDGTPTPIQKVNINTAEPWLLEALSGIGPTRAQAIVDYRDEHGPFRRAEDLERVDGIGPGIVAKIREFITVGE
jgi:competence protein ComEA